MIFSSILFLFSFLPIVIIGYFTIRKGLTENLSENGIIIITIPGSLAIGIFDKDAKDEHNGIFSKEEFYKLASNTGLRVEHYSSFEFGLNNLIVMPK